jgi:hypothetical protein
VHAIANVLDALPKRLQGNAKKLLHEMIGSDVARRLPRRAGRFRERFDAKYPKIRCSRPHHRDECGRKASARVWPRWPEPSNVPHCRA